MKRILLVCSFAMIFSSCEELKQIASASGIGGVTETEAGQGIKEALAQGLVKSVLQLNRRNVDDT